MLLALGLTTALLVAPQAAPEAPGAQTALGAKVWLGRYAEFEGYLKTAAIERIKDVGVGVTHPRRAYFKPGGLAGSAAVKHIPPGRQGGFWESYKSEIAAYELDRLLEMDMVPVTVERRVEGNLVSVQLWAEGCKWLKDLAGQSAPDVSLWNRQVHRHRIFDNLIANIDRNAGNLLVDQEWNLILIDHSRAFTDTMQMPFEKEMTRIDRPLYERLKALDEPTLKARLRQWVLNDGAIRAVLKRRDRIVQRFEKLAAEKGEAAVFVP